MKKRLSALLAVIFIMTMVVPVSAGTENIYPNTYVNTGNQRQDLIGVALTQIGYTELYDNDTKYGDWFGLPYQPWCAMFISWCAEQADISPRILQRSAVASPRSNGGFNVPCYSGKDYIPQPGDLLFIKNFSHIGIVYAMDGEYVITIEANTNNDGSDNGYYAMFHRRKLDECYVGVPAYEGCDAPHTYIRGSDEFHPHANYYYCTTCGDQYYTGTNGHLTNCNSCMSCGCAETGAWYRVTAGKRLVVRKGHSTNYASRGYLDVGESVYVLANNDSWGHILYANSAGYVPMNRLERFVPAPTAVASNQLLYYKNDTAYISWDPADTATNYTVSVLRDGTLLQQTAVGNVTGWNVTGLQPGNYEVLVTADDGVLTSASDSCSFTVHNTYDIRYDAVGGIGAPEMQRKPKDQELTLSTGVPTREGYVFLGWSEDAAANYAVYQPGVPWTKNQDTTLYAVWQSAAALPTSLSIETPAITNTFAVGQPVHTKGLALKLTYSDGASIRVTDGYTTEGLSSATAGMVSGIVYYKGLYIPYPVEIIDFIPGDTDGNFTVNKEDVMQLLWHISFPEMYPITIPADYTGDRIVDKEDVMQLLWHVSFPEMYPLN